jgi:putative glycosyltransferase (TIGR04372 family)
MLFQTAKLTVYYRDDRAFKRDLLDIDPYIDERIVAKGREVLPVGMFYEPGDRFVLPGSQEFIDRGHDGPDIFLVPSMMQLDDLLRFERTPSFRVPDARRSQLEERLVSLGLDPTRWFCCIFYRDPSYKLRPPTPYRESDDRTFEALACYIINDLGGQVVRLGHPEMRPFDLGAGFIDLSRLENEFMTHTAAVGRARFMIANSSGPGHLPGALDVPYAIVNSISLHAVWRMRDLVLPGHLFDENGKRMDVHWMPNHGFFNFSFVRNCINQLGFKTIGNSFEELREVANMLWSETQDCTGWRIPAEPLAFAPVNHYDIPQPFRRKIRIVEFPQFWPKAP